MTSPLRRFAEALGTVWMAISVVLLLVTVLTVLCQIAFRYLLAFPLAWTEEVSRLALVCAVYAGLPPAYLKAEQIVVDFFVAKLPEPLFTGYVIGLKAVSAAVIAYLAAGAFLQIGATWEMTLIALPTVPVAVVYAIQAASLACFALLIVITWRDPWVYIPREVGDDT
ncbi:TRAP transporter small permease [Oleispirillum naphthae]|uniref:TRAP transporter small permease n=1 Tax=Oleispirillum naphthae TaxID=2838853 RepID=UPI00308254C0